MTRLDQQDLLLQEQSRTLQTQERQLQNQEAKLEQQELYIKKQDDRLQQQEQHIEKQDDRLQELELKLNQEQKLGEQESRLKVHDYDNESVNDGDEKSQAHDNVESANEGPTDREITRITEKSHDLDVKARADDGGPLEMVVSQLSQQVYIVCILAF